MAIFGQSYGPIEQPISTEGLTEEEQNLAKKKNEQKVSEAVKARETFIVDVLPKLEEKMENISKVLRWTLQIAEGESTEDIMKADDDKAKNIVDNKRPLYQEVIMMSNSIEKVKLILKKSKDIKDEMKYDIHE